MELLEVLKNRYSCRNFLNKEVEETKINYLLEAVRLTPTACNKFPIRIKVINTKIDIEKVHIATKFNFNEQVIFIFSYDETESYIRGYDNKNYGELEFDCVLFKRTVGIKKPVYVFEINGGEHLGNLKREKSDRRKMLICKKEKVKLIFIPNSFAKEYGFIINIINASKRENKHVQISLFD